MKASLIIICLLAFFGTSWAQESKTQTVVIHTSAECGQCKQRIEEALNYTKGVVYAELDVATKNVTIKYNAKKTDVAKLRAAINKLGYDADDQKAEQAAVDQLPACCKPDGMKKH